MKRATSVCHHHAVTFGDYLASIDWVGAIITAIVLTAVALIVYRFVAASTTEIGSMLPGAGRATAGAILDSRSGLPIDSWVCGRCRSVNPPSAANCYHGCGPRDALARELSEDRSILGRGHNGRRG